MKKILMSIAAMALVLVGCNKDFEGRLTDLENRVSALEEYVTNLNNEVNGIQTIVTSLQSKVYVTGVEAVKNDSGAETGYKITFNQGNPIIINHGKTGDKGQTGAPGLTPGIDMFEGEWYWKYVGGEWILDSAGNKIPVTKSLKFEVNDEGNLYVSIDGAPVELVGNVQGAQGDSWFDGVTVDEEAGTVTISIADSDHDLVLPFNAAAADEFALNLQLPESTDVLLGGTIELSYTIAGCPADAAAVFVQTPEDWTAVLDETNRKITLTVGEKSGRVVVYAINNETGEIKAKFVNYDPSDMVVLGITEDKYYFTPKGGTFTIPVSTGINYDIQHSNWLEVTKKVVTKGVQHTELVVEAKENATSNSRTGDLTLMTREGDPLFTMNFEQKNYLPALIFDENGDPVKWQETFDLKVGETTTAKKNDITIELSDDFSKGTYLIRNMFVADNYFIEGGFAQNKGADYYADVKDNVLTVFERANHPSYFDLGELTFTLNLDEMTITSASDINCRIAFNPGPDATISNYKIAIKSESAGGAESPYAAYFGEFTESFMESYNGYPAKGKLVIEASDDPAHHLKVTFFSGKPCAVTTYADVSADGTKITTVNKTGTNMGTFYSSTLDVYMAGGVLSAVWGTLNFDYPTISDYAASR